MFAIRVLILTFVTVTFALEDPAEIRYEWKYLNFTWESAEQYQEAVDKGDYIPKHNAIVGVKVWEKQMFLTIPRFRGGVPATLVKIPLHVDDGNKSPNVEPYPNWKMQKIGDCNAFQSIKSMEIDPAGRMWIIDTGHLPLLEENKPICPPRLIVLDLTSNGKILLDYKFPEDVVDPKTNLLNDTVLDHKDGGYAFITDGDENNPSVVVFSLDQEKSWAVRDKSMESKTPTFKVKNDNVTLISPYGVNGIALSPVSTEGERLVYYSPMPSYDLYSIPTKILKENLDDVTSEVKYVGEKSSQTASMMMTANHELYFGLITDNQIAKWNTEQPSFTDNQELVAQDDDKLMWPDTFAVSRRGEMFVTSNRLEKSYTDQYDIDQENFRVIYLGQLDYSNYQYSDDGIPPVLPVFGHYKK